MTAAFLLAGLYMSREEAVQLFARVQVMHESTTYQYILEEGETKGKITQQRADLLRLLELRFRTAVPADLAAKVNGQQDLATLEGWFDQAATCASLDEFRAILST
jgi:hypothetical protein